MREVAIAFDRGLNFVRNKARIPKGQCYMLKNYMFGKGTLRRRAGKWAAYVASTVEANVRPVSMLKRWYKLALTGAIEAYFFKAAYTGLWKADNDWDDLSPWTATIATDGVWTAMTLPATANQSLRTLLTGTSASFTDGYLQRSLGYNNWCYLFPEYASTDDADYLLNCGMRTNGSKVYLHGCTPPAAVLAFSSVSGSHASGLESAKWYHYRAVYRYMDGAVGYSTLGTVYTYKDAAATPDFLYVTLTVAAGHSDDVTHIEIYRTKGQTAAGGATDPNVVDYYYVGVVTASTAPTTFQDTNADSSLTQLADPNVFMPPKCKTAVVWRNSLVMGNLKSRNTSVASYLESEEGGIHKNRLRWSEPGQPDMFRSEGYQDVFPDGDSGSIRRLVVSPLIDHLMVFMEEDVVAFSDLPGIPKNIANSRGTPARDSVIEYQGLIFYMTKQGIEVINGYEARDITSETIAPLWRELNSSASHYAERVNLAAIDKVRVTVIPEEDLIVWAYPAATATYNNRLLVLDLRQWKKYGAQNGVFTILEGWNISCFSRWDGEGDRGEIFGGEAITSVGVRDWTYRLFFGDEDQNGNGATAISYAGINGKIYLGLSDLDRPDMRKAFQYANFRALGGGQTSVLIDLDIDDGAYVKRLGEFDFENLVYFWGLSVWGEGTWDGPRIARRSTMLPRAAQGVVIGFQLETTDILDGVTNLGPVGFELYDIAITARPLFTKVRK